MGSAWIERLNRSEYGGKNPNSLKNVEFLPVTFQNNPVQIYLALPILNILVPQVGQIPEVAGRLFFITMALAAFISFLARHLTQYASILHLLLNTNDIPFQAGCQ
jgi:hypothetical protein